MGLVRTTVYCLKLRHNDKLSPEQIREIQQAKLRKAVRFAKKNSPFYAEHYKDIDPDAPDFSVRSLPPVTKDILTENFDRVVTDSRITHEEAQAWARDPSKLGRKFKGKFIVTHTSGTTGMPAYFVYNQKEWDQIQAIAVTRGIRFKPSFFQFFRYLGRVMVKKVRVALVSVLGGHFVTYLMFLVTPKLGRLISRFQFISVVKPLSELVEELNEFQPNIIHCYPTMLEVLAYEQNEGRLKIKPWIVTSSSEPLTVLARRVIQKAFPGSPVYENYGTTEGITIGSECHEHGGMHINSDNYIVETVRDDGTLTEPEEAGDKVYLSCLFSRVMPLLRYELTDVTIRLAEPCPCGLPFDMIKVRGRTDDIFWVYDKQNNPVAMPPIPFEAMLLDIQGMRQYQLVQEERNRLKVYFRPFDDVDPAWVQSQIQTKLNAFLSEKGLADCVTGEVEQVSEIARDPKSGKIRQIRSKVERLYLPGMALGERRSGEDRRSFARRAAEGERRGARRADDGRRSKDERREVERRSEEEIEQERKRRAEDQGSPEGS